MKDQFKEFKPSSWAINNRTAIYILTIIITLAGLMTYNNLPKEQFPEIKMPQIIVQTFYPGTSPQNHLSLRQYRAGTALYRTGSLLSGCLFPVPI